MCFLEQGRAALGGFRAARSVSSDRGSTEVLPFEFWSDSNYFSPGGKCRPCGVAYRLSLHEGENSWYILIGRDAELDRGKVEAAAGERTTQGLNVMTAVQNRRTSVGGVAWTESGRRRSREASPLYQSWALGLAALMGLLVLSAWLLSDDSRVRAEAERAGVRVCVERGGLEEACVRAVTAHGEACFESTYHFGTRYNPRSYLDLDRYVSCIEALSRGDGSLLFPAR